MRVLVLLIVVLVVACVALAIYAAHLRRTIRESDNPLLALPRKQRAKHALELLEYERNRRSLSHQQDLDNVIFGTRSSLPNDRKDSK